MATNYNYFGNLVTSGLVLDLDAAKIDSYPGSGTTWRDISGNNLTGSLVNGPTFTGIGKQAAIVFDGTNDLVGISSSALLAAGTNDFCADFWLYPTSYPTLYNPVFVAEGTNGMWIGRNQSNFVLRAYAVADRIQNPILPATGSWTNVSITRNGTNNVMYYNGAPSATSASNQNYAQFSTYIGSDGAAATAFAYYTGRIASTRFYNKGLSQFEVWQNFNAIKGRYGIPDIVTNGLVLNLDAGNPFSYLSGSSGTTWTNTVAVSSSILGTLVNGPVYANGAITFDGVDDRMTTTLSLASYNNTTQILWYKWNGVNQIAVLSYLGFSGGNGFGLLMHDGSGGNIGNRIGVLYGGSFFNALNTGSLYATLSSNDWCQLAITRDTSTTILYFNGSVVGSTSRTPSTTSSYPYTYGSSVAGAAGSISATQFYTRALSATEVLQNFNALRGRYGI